MLEVLSNEAYTYLSANDEYFWRWAEDGEVIEWRNGTTLAYRSEVVALMAHLKDTGLPPFGALLLFLAACRRGWLDSTAELGILQAIARRTRKEQPFARVRPMLDIIAQLPEPLRSGVQAQSLLAGLLFESISWKLSGERSQEILAVLRQDEMAAAISGNTISRLADHAFTLDLRALESALKGLNPKLLERRIRTGMEAEIIPPRTRLTEPAPRDLLSELAADPTTEGLARLTRRLLAVIRLPRETHGAGSLPFGGFEDITNRGNPDRLLISELALDDLTLATRIANGEALYLRREAPPAKPRQKRIILLDNGIRLWGVPRVFALSVALALVHGDRNCQDLQVLGHLHDRFRPADLQTRAGIDAQLEALDPAPHPGHALRRLDAAELEDAEVILITHEAVLRDRTFLLALAALPRPLSYLIPVDRNGSVRLIANLPAGQKTLAQAVLDLSKILTPGDGTAPLRRQDQPGNLPLIFSCEPFPFRLPAHLFRGGKPATIHPEIGVVAVTNDRRLLHWDSKELGGRQVIGALPVARAYFTAVNSQAHLAVLALEADNLRLFTCDLAGENHISHDLGATEDPPLHLEMATDWCLIFRQGDVAVHDWETGRCLERAAYPSDAYLWWGNVIATEGRLLSISYNGSSIVYTQLTAEDTSRLTQLKDPKRLTTYTQSSYSMMHRFRLIGLNSAGGISLQSTNDRLWDICIASGHLRVVYSETREVRGLTMVQPFEPIPGPLNAGYTLRQAIWPRGDAILDSRGLLHLRSHDPELPEITLGLSHNKPLPAWSSQGSCAGPPHFFPKTTVSPVEFYSQLSQLLGSLLV